MMHRSDEVLCAYHLQLLHAKVTKNTVKLIQNLTMTSSKVGNKGWKNDFMSQKSMTVATD